MTLQRLNAAHIIVLLYTACMEAEQKSSDDDAGTEVQDSDANLEDSDAPGPEEPVDSGTMDTAAGDSGDSDESQSGVYCEGNDSTLANCDPDVNYDPWIAGTGEVHYWIRDRKTEVFPFTTEDRPDVWYGYLQMTSPEVARDLTEDMFHVWFSETPNGPLYGGEDCEWYTRSAEGYLYWTFKEGAELEGVCHLGDVPRTMYVNFETRCHPDYFEGLCDDDNKQKSDRVYQFDVSRRFSNY